MDYYNNMFEYILAGFTGTFFSYYVAWTIGACCQSCAYSSKHTMVEAIEKLDRNINRMLVLLDKTDTKINKLFEEVSLIKVRELNTMNRNSYNNNIHGHY